MWRQIKKRIWQQSNQREWNGAKSLLLVNLGCEIKCSRWLIYWLKSIKSAPDQLQVRPVGYHSLKRILRVVVVVVVVIIIIVIVIVVDSRSFSRSPPFHRHSFWSAFSSLASILVVFKFETFWFIWGSKWAEILDRQRLAIYGRQQQFLFSISLFLFWFISTNYTYNSLYGYFLTKLTLDKACKFGGAQARFARSGLIGGRRWRRRIK